MSNHAVDYGITLFVSYPMRDVINSCSDFENKNKLSYKVSIDSRRD